MVVLVINFFPFHHFVYVARHSLVACKVSAETADGLMSPIVVTSGFLRMLLRFSIYFFSYLNYNVLWLDLLVNLIWESDFQAQRLFCSLG